MLKKFFFGSLLVGLVLGSGFAFTAEPVHLYDRCVDVTDKEARTRERNLCDDTAEELGYVHGVLRPVPGGKCAAGPEIRPFECVGVGPEPE